jgi:hypothetical protein
MNIASPGSAALDIPTETSQRNKHGFRHSDNSTLAQIGKNSKFLLNFFMSYFVY